MDAAWNTLREAGVPDGPARPPGRGPLDGAAVRAAVRAVSERRGTLDERERATLLAWLGGFRHHWPGAFAALLGDDGDALLAWLAAEPFDRNRYLKLRRIAISNLAGRL